VNYFDEFSFDLFDKKVMPLLPCFVKPQPEELFSSWLVRLSYAHSMKVHTFTHLCFPGYQFWNRDIDRSVKNELLNAIATRTNCIYEQIFSTTLRSYEGVLFESHSIKTTSNWIIPLGIYHRTWKNKGLMFCPSCLMKDSEPYFRKQWRLSLSVVCTSCSTILLDQCPNCNAAVSFFRNELGKKSKEPDGGMTFCFNCKSDLKNASCLSADISAVRVQNQINSILNGHIDNLVYPFQYFDVIKTILKLLVGRRRQSVLVQKRLAETLNIEFLPQKGGVNNRFDVLSVEQRIRALKMAFWLLDQWPIRFIDFFTSLKVYSSDLIRDSKNLPFWYWSVVYENFYKTNVNRKFRW